MSVCMYIHMYCYIQICLEMLTPKFMYKNLKIHLLINVKIYYVILWLNDKHFARIRSWDRMYRAARGMICALKLQCDTILSLLIEKNLSDNINKCLLPRPHVHFLPIGQPSYWKTLLVHAYQSRTSKRSSFNAQTRARNSTRCRYMPSHSFSMSHLSF